MTSEYAWRFDGRGAGPVSKGPGRSAGGKGYNPYRAGDGKFAPGAHKERPRVARAAGASAPVAKGRSPAKAKAPARTKFNAEPHKQLIAGHKAVEAHHRGESLRLASEMKALKEQAKTTKPRSAERAALKEQHAALKAQRDEHKTKATAARTERIAASKGMQAARKEHAAGGKVVRPNAEPGAARRHQESTASPGERLRESLSKHLTPGDGPLDRAAGAEVRNGLREVNASYGLTDSHAGAVHANVIQRVAPEAMGGSYAGFAPADGRMLVSHDATALISEHSKISSAGLHDLGRKAEHGDEHAQDLVFAKHSLTHESVHGTGPVIAHDAHRGTIEELTTEMSARRITADAHGIDPFRSPTLTAYDHIIDPVVAHVAATTGVSHEAAYRALEGAALNFKRGSGNTDADNAIHAVSVHVAKTLNFDGPAIKISQGIYRVSNATGIKQSALDSSIQRIDEADGIIDLSLLSAKQAGALHRELVARQTWRTETGARFIHEIEDTDGLLAEMARPT